MDPSLTIAVLFLAALAGAGFLGTVGTPAQTPEAKGPADSAKAVKGAEPSKTFEVQGRVLGPDGKPVANAEVFVCARWAVASDAQKDKGEKLPSPRAITDADGKYRFSATQAEMDQNLNVVAAVKDLGPDWVPLTRLNRGGGLPDLRLVKDDVPISGRILDLESLPVANATVTVLRVLKAPGENLLEVAWKATTGADGRFEMRGFGRDRVVVLAVDAPGLAREVVEVVTRPALPKGVPIFAAKVERLLAPAKPIEGTVRDTTGKPAAGVEVTHGSSQAITDAEGRYRLTGVEKSKRYYPAARGGPYILLPQLVVEDTPGVEAITADFEVERGLELRGRLIDKATGRPVRGVVFLGVRSRPTAVHVPVGPAGRAATIRRR
jgi:hypothetical protein